MGPATSNVDVGDRIRGSRGAATGAERREASREGVEVRAARTRRELNEFIRLPWQLYESEANGVPPLISERRRHLSRKHSRFFEHAEAKYLIAWRRGEPVGLISAHIDERFNDFHDNAWGPFGFFECVEDPDVAAALLDAAEAWLCAGGRDRMTIA